MVDPTRVQPRLELLRTYVARLDELRQLPPDEYVEEEAFAGRYLVQAAAKCSLMEGRSASRASLRRARKARRARIAARLCKRGATPRARMQGRSNATVIPAGSTRICIDIANHLIAAQGWRAPLDFRDSFTVLNEQGVVEADLASRLKALAGLRNRLVHLYDEVDDYFVHEALQDGLADLHGFARAVTTFVSGSDSG